MENEVRPLIDRRSTIFLPWDPIRAKKSGILILISVVFERFAFYAVVMNLFLYLNRGQPQIQSWDPIDALTAIFVINGIACISSPLGGILSDSFVGRFWSIVIGMIFYILGYLLLTTLAVNMLYGCNLKPNGLMLLINNSSHPCSLHIYIISILIGTGMGCVRANIVPFLAEQVRVGSIDAIHQFFNAYYWCANMGALIGVGVLAYVEQNFENGFFIAFVTSTISLCISLLFFCSGRCYYVVHRPGTSVITNIFRIMAEGLQNSFRKDESNEALPNRRMSHSNPGISVALGPPSWIDRAKVSYGGSFHDATVDDVKQLAQNMAFIILLLPYWLVYLQMQTLFQAQGLHMRLGFNTTLDSFVIPSAWLTLCDQMFIIVFIPLLSFVIYPLCDRYGHWTSPLNRIRMLASLAAIIVAGIVENFRIEELNHGSFIIQYISNTSYNASSMPILWQIPQYCLTGTAEVMAGVAGLEFAYTTAPRTFQGVIMGLYWAVEGLASFLGLLLIQITHALHLGWIRNDLHFNSGHLDYFFYLLAIIQAVTIVILGLVLYLRWEPLVLDQQESNLEATVGASALHSDLYLNRGPLMDERNPIT